jgi:hypothetical protein
LLQGKQQNTRLRGDIIPADIGKTTNTTFTTIYNFTSFACITILLQGKQHDTTFSVSHEQN